MAKGIRSAAVLERASRMPKTMRSSGRRSAISKAKRNFRGGFASSMGYKTEGSRVGDQSVGQLLNGQSGAGVLSSTYSKLIHTPSLERPARVSTVQSASITTISKQIDQLASVAEKIGLTMQHQQKTVESQIDAANRATKQQELESKSDADLIQGATYGVIGPNQDAFENFYKALKEITTSFEDAIESLRGNGSGGGSGLDILGRSRGRLTGGRPGSRSAAVKARAASMPRTMRASGRRIAGRNFRGGFASSMGYKTGGSRAGDRLFGRAAASLRPAIASVGRVGAVTGGVAAAATAAGGRVSTGKATDSLIRGIGRSQKTTGANRVAGSVVTGSASAVKQSIAKAATPIVRSALAKTAIKSIPIVGAVAGIGFAAHRLLKGDPVGAGLDAASGLAGPLTAIPALAASLSRDVYTTAFGIMPERDPMFASRMALVSGVVTSLLHQFLASKIKRNNESANKTTGTSASTATSGSGSIPNPNPQPSRSPPPAATPTPPPTSPVGQAPAPSPPAVERSQNTSTASASPQAARVSAPPPTSERPTQPPVTGTSPRLEGEEGTQPNTAGSGVNITPQKLGEKLLAASTSMNESASNFLPAQPATLANRVMPQTTPTTAENAYGIGNVPDPTYYDMGRFQSQLFFRAHT